MPKPQLSPEYTRKIKALYAGLRRLTARNSPRWGRLGERDAKVGFRKVRIPSLTGTAKFRIPDVLSDTQLIEVKNVAVLHWSAQLRDFLAFCEGSQRQMVLCVRQDTRLSPEIQRLRERNKLEVRFLSTVFTERSQKLLSKALAPVIEKALRGII